MKRIYSIKDFKVYTMLKQILIDLELVDKDYLWLISDIEAYPRKEKYENLVQEEYLLMNTRELVKILEDDDFQWIWAVFSAIPPIYSREDILRFDLPYIKDVDDRKHNPHEGIPKIQHPYAEFVIYAVDSSYMFMISDDEELIDRFKKKYPKYNEE